ncbi:MAG: hemin-degrading factor [Proteobacteria bacterium]|jgi:putative hemin transport protein|nr:hemin-degrading factor [Methylibium sp.]MBY0368481.1 hemin-degrading factor [Burkholderiaceae bacterium]MCH8854883.1 hemin-degrading factor [Pseudomonadota bacterium]|mmetsp:Transcript_5758/g.14047  ORF Transcript_5758/g.14047 Transcript_5758/m.14047 type:complete len:360 (+) Transcript_5758:1679-2758(+)
MDLRQAYLDARAAGHTRHRDIALSLGITEGMLIDAHVGAPAGGLQAQRLRRDFPALLSALGHAGEVMALTRNAHCVHERTGVYEQLSAQGEPGREMGMALGEEIDLRLFYSHWAHGYAVHESTPQGEQQSLQFFDARGVAVHKVFTRPGTHLAAWQALRIGWADPAAPAPQWRHEAPPAAVDAPDVNAGAFRAGWAALRDTHEFFGLLRKHGLTRRTAMHLAAPEFAQRVDPHAARVLLEGAAANGTPIMVFVGNPGVIQIHGGPIKRVAVMGPWLNVLDPRFNLHLREDAIAEAWAVRKPTVDGLVSSLELYAADGELIAQFFGQRKPGQPERCSWRQLLDGLVDDPSWCQQAAGCAA